MISSFLRNVGRFLVLLAVVVSAVIANFWAIPEHYLQLKGGLEMAGFEQQTLESDPLMGPLFGLIFPEATLPLLMALSIALVEALSLFLWFHECFEVYALAGIRHESRLAGLAEDVREATRRIVQSGMMLVFTSALLFWVIRWDVEIFRFRSLYSAFGPEGPATPGDVASWDLYLRDHADQYVTLLAQYGAWGYIAVTAAACLALEWTFLKLGVSFAQVLRPVDEAWGRWETQETVETETVVSPTPADGQPTSTESHSTLFDPDEAFRQEQATPRSQGRAREQALLYDVIGRVPASRVNLDEALADQSRYHVDRAQGRVTIWDRTYWNVLRNHHAPNPNPVSENEEAPV